MTRRLGRFLQALLLIGVAGPLPALTQRSVDDAPGIRGRVVGPDGTPVQGGTLMIQSSGGRVTSGIDRSGQFQLLTTSTGLHLMSLTTSSFAPYRVYLTVPASRRMTLPVIRLSPATLFRVQFVSASGEPIRSPNLRRQSFDMSGALIAGAFEERGADQIDAEGAITIGPLPSGITTLALDSPPFARTRLPDLQVTGAEPFLDGGTVIVQPGAVLHVDVVDGTGGAVVGHDVVLEDARPLSPLSYGVARTNQQGRATFERLAAGRYLLRTRTLGSCERRPLSMARLISIAGSGTLRTRLVVGGTAAFRVQSPFGPLQGVLVMAAPDAAVPPRPTVAPGRLPALGMRPAGPFSSATPCGGRTDGEGRLSLKEFPPGASRVEVRMPNSTYTRRVTVTNEPRDIVVDVPGGVLPLRVLSAIGNTPVPRAILAWSGAGATVEAVATAVGEALLEAVGSGPGTLKIEAPGFEPLEMHLSEPPGTLLEIVLTPQPDTTVQARVVTTAGQPVSGAIVAVSPGDPMQIGHIAAADVTGQVTLTPVPAGPLRVTVTAHGFLPATTRIADGPRHGLVLTLSPPKE